jgi:hypothetical protein
MSSLAGLLVIALLLALPYVWYRCHSRLRAKGYGRALITTAFVVLLFTCLAIGGSLTDERVSAVAPFALWIATSLAITWLAPYLEGSIKDGRVVHRGRRTTGKRRALRATVLGWVFVAAAGVMTLFFVWQLVTPTIVPRGDSWRLFIGVVFLLLVGSHWFGVAGRSTHAPERLDAAPGAVLYLRSFDEEDRPFAIGPRSALKKYTGQFVAHAPLVRGDPTLRLTLEDYLEEEITARLGPFVGLGNPYDRAAPDGATREYAADHEWQSRFLDLAGKARCIVASIGSSTNLEWELARIKEHGWGRKLCLFTSPVVPGADTKILNRLRGTAAARTQAVADSWAQASAVLGRVGFTCAENPGTGAAITFDEDGSSTVITQAASTPAEFVAPVAAWFNAQSQAGAIQTSDAPSDSISV